MDKISATAYIELVQSSKVLEKDGHGEKVLLTEDGQIVKIFRRKQLLSSAIFFPYVRRFAANAKRLKCLDIHTITVLRLAQCSQPKRDLVWYEPIAGEIPLRLFTPPPIRNEVASELPSALKAAIFFWKSAAVDERISAEFRQICYENCEILQLQTQGPRLIS